MGIVDRIECVRCGTVWERERKKGGRLPIYCPDCAAERRKERTLQWSREQRAAGKDKARVGKRKVGDIETITCIGCGDTFENEVKLGPPPKLCSVCRPERAHRRRRAWVEAHPEKQEEARRQWREANPEKRREIERAWVEANPEKVAEKARRYREANRARMQEMDRAKREKRSPLELAQIARRHALARFGLTEQTFDEILAAQGGACAICGTTEPGGPHKQWNMDHDHACPVCGGKKGCPDCFRALLCARCNMGIGTLRDDPEIMRAAADYVERWHQREQ